VADLAKQPVPEPIKYCYEKTRLNFVRRISFQKPFDPRLIAEKYRFAVAKAPWKVEA